MITSINTNNNQAYKEYFEDVTTLLRTHNIDGEYVGDDPNSACLKYRPIKLDNADAFMAYLNMDDQELFIVTKDETDASALPVYTKVPEDATFNTEAEYCTLETITSLAQLYSHLYDLARISPRRIILPLEVDEPYFMVDLNTRQIKPHKFFDPNGLSVRGDESAEVIYFESDRYYDHMDLYGSEPDEHGVRVNPVDIFIEWQYSYIDADKKQQTVKGVSVPWIIDAESKQDKIIFGWVINGEITKYAGAVTFAVRYYIAEGKNIRYSLSTLPYTAGKIKDTLNFEIYDIKTGSAENSVYKEGKNDFLSLIQNNPIVEDSELSGVGGRPVEAPVFLAPFDFKGNQYMNMKEADGVHKELQPIMAEATIPSTGDLSYVWKKQSLDGEESLSISYPQDENGNNGVYYIQLENIDEYFANPGQKTVYYKKKKPVSYCKLSHTITKEQFMNNASTFGENLFYKKTSINIDSIGRYQVIAYNFEDGKFNSTISPLFPDVELNEDGTKPKQEPSWIYVYGPEQPIIETNFEKADNAPCARIYFTDTTDATLTITGGYVDDETHNEHAEGTLGYRWYFQAPKSTEWVLLTDADGNDIQGGTLKTSEVGTYKAVVVNQLNRYPSDQAATNDEFAQKDADGNSIILSNGLPLGKVIENESVESNLCRVSNAVITSPQLTRKDLTQLETGFSMDAFRTKKGLNGFEIIFSNLDDNNRPIGEEPHDITEDGYTYDWYYYNVWNAPELKTDSDRAEQGLATADADWEKWGDERVLSSAPVLTQDCSSKLTFADIQKFIDNYNGPDKNKMAPGNILYFYCVVSHIFNGKVATKLSPFFAIFLPGEGAQPEDGNDENEVIEDETPVENPDDDSDTEQTDEEPVVVEPTP